MTNNAIFIELGSWIINLNAVAFVKGDGNTLNVGFAAAGANGPMTISLTGNDAARFMDLLRSNRTIVQ